MGTKSIRLTIGQQPNTENKAKLAALLREFDSAPDGYELAYDKVEEIQRAMLTAAIKLANAEHGATVQSYYDELRQLDYIRMGISEWILENNGLMAEEDR
ncbi:hypothetical protein PV375_01035 [Gulosibacter sp. GYB002]|uniref:hypothetical protein n=1 Tax=Gulosibacter sp. GYB002 TaxID=2994391 RepID=UPI002F96152E